MGPQEPLPHLCWDVDVLNLVHGCRVQWPGRVQKTAVHSTPPHSSALADSPRLWAELQLPNHGGGQGFSWETNAAHL